MTSPESSRHQQLRELVDFPRENLAIEIKNWLDVSDGAVKAHVARELLALANHGGGFLIFGFDETSGGFSPSLPPPADLSPYGQDTMNGIVSRYAEPAFEVEVEFAERSDQQSTHPVVIVPSDLDVPVRAKRDGPGQQHVTQNRYYIRRPGPQSAPIQTGREWDALLDRCIRTKRDELLERFREIIEGPAAFTEATRVPDNQLQTFVDVAISRFRDLAQDGLPEGYPGRYQHGTWHFAYRVVPPLGPEFTLPRLRATLEEVVGHETGWPPWWLPNLEGNAPRAWEGRIECWMAGGTFLDASHSDYWLCEPTGALFLLRGYDDDSEIQGAPEPGRFLDLTLPVWRIGACLLHANRFARAVTESLGDAQVDVVVRWTGLQGRQLTTWASPNRMMMPVMNEATDTVDSSLTIEAADIGERLPEAVRALTQPLYEAFQFFEPAAEMFIEELDALRGRRRG